MLVPGEMGHAGFSPLSESLVWQTFTSPIHKSANTTFSLLGYSQGNTEKRSWQFFASKIHSGLYLENTNRE